jgi:hypothetical protein
LEAVGGAVLRPRSTSGAEADWSHQRCVSDGQPARARAELVGALEALGELEQLVLAGEAAFRESLDRRQRVRYLWIVAGSRLKNYCQLIDIPRAAGEMGQAIGFRHTLAYSAPSRVSDDVVWRTSVGDLPRLTEVIRETANALGDQEEP